LKSAGGICGNFANSFSIIMSTKAIREVGVTVQVVEMPLEKAEE